MVFDEYIDELSPVIFSGNNGKRLFVTAKENRFSILVFRDDFTVITISIEYLDKIRHFFDINGDDVFSENALNWIKEHFSLNSCENPIEHVYVADDEKQHNHVSCTKQPVCIDYTVIKGLDPNPFKKYPFRNAENHFIYFGIYENNNPVCLVSGYVKDTKIVELTGETLTEYREKGYAKAVTSAITGHLLNEGYIVITKNGINNAASIRTVQSLGFKECARELKFAIK